MSHLLNLKVLRLSKPSFLIQASQEEPLTDFLSLPVSFGNIYLGETFTSYLCVNNDSITAATDVAFKAELQTTSQRFTLADTIGVSPTSSLTGVNANINTKPSSDKVSLLPKQSAEFILHHEIKELGIHILVCSVHYSPSANSSASLTTPDQSRKFFRKFFKFQVLNPLSIKTKVNSPADGRIILEIQLQNLASIGLFIDRIEFYPNPLFIQTEVANNLTLLESQDINQYLHVLTPAPGSMSASRSCVDLGRLDIFWKSTLGQTGTNSLISGHLQTSQLTRKIPFIQPLRLEVISAGLNEKIETKFKVTFRVTNNLSDRLQLKVNADSHTMGSLVVTNSMAINLGPLDGNATLEFELELLCLRRGMLDLKGVKITDVISSYSTDIPLMVTAV